MSNPANFTGLEGAQLLQELKPFISSQLPVLNEALRQGYGTWKVEGSRFIFRYAPRAYSRLNTLISVYNGEQLRPYSEIVQLLEERKEEPLQLSELEALAAMAHEAEALRQKFMMRSNSLTSSSTSWDDVTDEEQGEEAEVAAGLSVFVQDWWTSTKGKQKRSHEGLEICFLAKAEEAEVEAEAESSTGGWNT